MALERAGTTPEQPIETRIVRSSGWVAIGFGGAQVLTLLSMLVLARLLEPAAFGLLALTWVFLTLLEQVQASGLGAALVYRRADLEASAASVLVYSPVLALVLYGATFGLAPVLAGWFDAPALTSVLRVMGVLLLIRSLSIVPAALLERELDFRSIAKAELAGALTQVGLAVGLAVAGAGVWSLVAGYLAGFTIQGALLWALVPWRPSPRNASWSILREMIGYGRFVGAAHIVNLVNRTFDNVVVGRVLGTAALGLYAVSFRIASSPANVISQILGRAMFSAYSQLRGDLAACRHAYVLNLQRVTLLALPLSVTLTVAAEPIVLGILGPRWLDAVPALRILAVYGLVKSLAATCGAVWLGRGRPQNDLIAQSAHAVLLVPAVLLLTPPFGLVGAACAMLLVDVLTGLPALLVTMRMLELRPAAAVRALAPALLCSLLLAGALALLLPAQDALPAAAALALVVGAGAVVYAVATAVFARKLVVPIWASLRGAGT